MLTPQKKEQYPWLQTLIDASPDEIDLTNELLGLQIEETVRILLDQNLSAEEIGELETTLLSDQDTRNIFALLALKVARSKRLVEKIDRETHVSVVFAVYKEHQRIRKSSEEPLGEDFLRRKVTQLQRLFEINPLISWDLHVVDDGCPENSGAIAEEIIKDEGWDNVLVHYLSEAIEQSLPPAADLSSTNDSQKGGSIEFGLWKASMQDRQNHIVIYTDADLSTHLGQSGLLLDPILSEGKNVAIGSRREADSVVLKQGSRNNRGKLFIYLWKRLVPTLGDIIDTQCGFKAFRAETVREISSDLIEKKFAFDIELLIRSELVKSGSIEKVGIAWIDSEAASTTTDIQPYLPMLKAIVKMYRKYLPENSISDSFATLIDGLSPDEFKNLLEHIPTEITSCEPVEFKDYTGVSAETLASAAKTTSNG